MTESLVEYCTVYTHSSCDEFEQRQLSQASANRPTKSTDLCLGCEFASRLLSSASTIDILVLLSLKKKIIMLPTASLTESTQQALYSKDVQPLSKAVRYIGFRDKHTTQPTVGFDTVGFQTSQ